MNHLIDYCWWRILAGLGLQWPYGSLSAQDILWFYDSMIRALLDPHCPDQPPVGPLSIPLSIWPWFQLSPGPSVPVWAVSEDCWFPAWPQPFLPMGSVDQDPDMKAAFMAWPQTCLITRNFLDDMHSWLSLDAISGSCPVHLAWVLWSWFQATKHLICWLDIMLGFHLPIP